MVAGAKLARAQQRIVSLRPYALKTQEMLHDVAGTMRSAATEAAIDAPEIQPEALLHPLLQARPEKRVLYVVISGERGLCGGFNANINKAAEREWKQKLQTFAGAEGTGVEFVTIGKKGREYLNRRQANVAQDFERIFDGLSLEKSREISNYIIDRFKRGEVDAVYLIYNEFKSAIAQTTNVQRLLPLPERTTESEHGNQEFAFEPEPKTLLERLLPMYVEVSIFRSLLESQAGEFGARMSAMDAATRNAKEMIGRLTLVYNRARQAAITKELMEIIGGAEALKD